MPPFGRSSTTSTWYSSAGHFPLSPLMQPPLPNCSESRSPRNQRHEPWSVDLEGFRPGSREHCATCRLGLSRARSEEHTSELQSLMRISYAVFCLKKKKNKNITKHNK